MAFFGEQCRFDRYDEIYVSPHLDDGVYSCAGRILKARRAGLRVLVVTLFGDGALEPLSQVTGRFADFETRRAEDRAAMAHLDADYVWLNFPDFVFRKPGFGDVMRIAFPFLRLPSSEIQRGVLRELLALFEDRLAPGGLVRFPFAIGFHPDHRIAFDVGRAVHALGRFRVEFYEDIPYTLAPVMVSLRLRYLGIAGQRTPLLKSALEMNFALFRFFRWPWWLTFPPTFLYTLVLLLVQRVLGGQDRLAGEPAPERRSEERVDDVIDDKLTAMRLYPTQTELFLAMDERLRAMLQEPGGFFERSWGFPSFPRDSERLRRLGMKSDTSM
jgi:LmbE family N-acetylglucosaminyl deacetylase